MKTTALIALALLAAACSNRNGDYDASGTFEATEVIVSAEGNGRIERFDVEEGPAPHRRRGGRIDRQHSALLQETAARKEHRCDAEPASGHCQADRRNPRTDRQAETRTAPRAEPDPVECGEHQAARRHQLATRSTRKAACRAAFDAREQQPGRERGELGA